MATLFSPDLELQFTWTCLLVTRLASCQLPTGHASMQGLGEDGPGEPLLPSTTGSRAAALCLPAALLAVHWGQGLEGEIWIIIPGQASRLQGMLIASSPQGRPPCWGWVRMVLVILCSPPPQVAEQLPSAFHILCWQSTGGRGEKVIEDGIYITLFRILGQFESQHLKIQCSYLITFGLCLAS